MALKKEETQVNVFKSAGNPNSANVAIFPNHIGDLCVDTTNSRLYVAYGLGSTDWGTLGTSLT